MKLSESSKNFEREKFEINELVESVLISGQTFHRSGITAISKKKHQNCMQALL